MTNLILIGFMGSGKTSVGIRLSYAYRVPFLDTDSEIERRQGMSVSDIFDHFGEAAFRQMEEELLRRLARERGRHILATGGGTPLVGDNAALLRGMGRVVYLRAKPGTIYQRIGQDTTRPLLAVPDPMGRIEELTSRRAPVYEACAHIVVDVDGKDMRGIVAEIRRKAGEFS